MHTEILSPEQVAVLYRLKAVPAVSSFYLAGRTALALRHGHRRSIDFDFFRQDSFDGEALIASLDDAMDAVERLPSGQHTAHLRLLGVSASFFRRPYPLLAPPEPKYGSPRTELYHRLRALSYFDDAEQQPMPDVVLPCDWEELRAFFTAEAVRLLAKGVAS
jgi:hypothetical protein